MANLKVVVETDYVGIDISYPLEVSDDEVEGLSDEDLDMKFADDAWETIKNNVCWHIERDDDE